MNNYVYIISSLPAISQNWKAPENFSSDALVEEIRRQCSKEDCEIIDILTDSFNSDCLTEEFYRKALGSRNAFIREYFKFDLNVRNARVRYINKALEREESQDVMPLDGGVFEESGKMEEALASEDIIAREKAMDDLTWNKVNEIVLFDYFDLKVILAFIAKLHIIDRWMRLDPQSGREMFRKLVEEVRGTFKGVENYNEKSNIA